MQKLPLTVIIPTFNEEKNIEACLKSVEWAEDILVIDGQSSDSTVPLAEKFQVRVIRTENALAETQRLKAVKQARHPWLLLLDADERVTENLRKSIEETIRRPSATAAYYVL